MRQQHEIEARGGKRQLELVPQHLRRSGRPATKTERHPVGAQEVQLTHAHLQGVVAEYVRHHLVERGLLPVEQVTALRRIQPVR